MTLDRWRQIEELFHAVRESPSDRHAALLAAADPDIRSEVESLLLAGQDKTLPTLELAVMAAIQAGTRLGPYLVESKLGEGGMGEVFRAVDTRLGRTVAIKVVHRQFDCSIRIKILKRCGLSSFLKRCGTEMNAEGKHASACEKVVCCLACRFKDRLIIGT